MLVHAGPSFSPRAVPLSVTQVRLLEAVALSESSHLADRLAAGHFLFCLYSSARFGDTQNLAALDLDVNKLGQRFLEGRTAKHKTSTSKEHQRLLLPLVALTQGLASKPWGPAWIRAREESNLQLGSGCPVLPAPSLATGWTRRTLTTAEASHWLRELLQRAGGRGAKHCSSPPILSSALCSVGQQSSAWP